MAAGEYFPEAEPTQAGFLASLGLWNDINRCPTAARVLLSRRGRVC